MNTDELSLSKSGFDRNRSISLVTPIISKDRFCENSGIRPDQLRGQIHRGNVKTIKIGRTRMINLARYAVDCDTWSGYSVVPVPIMTPGVFAEYAGVGDFWVRKCLAYDDLPLSEMGRLRLVNVAELFRRCLADEPELIH